MPRALSTDLRERVVTVYEEGKGTLETAQQFKIGLATVTRWVARKRETGSVAPLPRGGGNPRSVDDEKLGALVEEQPDRILSELVTTYEERTGEKTSKSAVGRALERLGLTRKKTFRATEGCTEKVEARRAEFAQAVLDIPVKELVFIDETGVNLGMKRLRARAAKGSRVHDHRPCNPGENITVIGALTLAGLSTLMTLDGAANGEGFLAFVRNFLVPTLKQGQVVVMDNAKVHKVNGVQEAIEAVGARLMYLPPYSPQYNPIEECWSKVKEFLRSAAARIREKLERALVDAWDAVTPQDAAGWFGDCGYR